MQFPRTIRAFVFAISTLVLVVAVFAAGMLLVMPKGVSGNVELATIDLLLRRFDIEEADFKTMIVGTSHDTTASPESVWKELTDLDGWTAWCPMTRGQTRWMEGYRWIPGAQFQHEVELGFPMGSARTTAFVEVVNPYRQLIWAEQRRGARVFRIWQIDPLPDGGSRVTCVEAARSLSTAVAKPFSVGPLQRSFEESVLRLVRHVEEIEARTGPAAVIQNPVMR